MSRFVLVHGAWSDSAAWNPVAAPDLPAHGGDSTPAPQASLDGHAVATAKAAATWRLATSHVPMLSDPDGLAAALLDLTA
jgi:hypothetical protein